MSSIASLSYSVYFDSDFKYLQDFLQKRNYTKLFILTDTHTGEHCLPVLQRALPPGLAYDLIEVTPGEAHKTIDFCIGIWRMLLDFGADRNSLLINLGGGVVTDMGGFAASTFKRGIDFVQIPTSLLAQVDASVGGKTGVDLDEVKNIIGTFTQPQAVFIHSKFIQTLDPRQIVSGFAEMIKHGLIQDKAYFKVLQAFSPDQIEEKWIHRSVEIKNAVVMADPTEKGLRKILNFGHTLGHAIESYSLAQDAEPLLHGEAIAVGMICEAFLAHRLCGLPKEDLEEITEYIRRVFPDYTYTSAIYPELLRIMQNDKKNVQGRISFSLLEAIGNCTYDVFPSEAEIIEALDYYQNTGT